MNPGSFEFNMMSTKQKIGVYDSQVLPQFDPWCRAVHIEIFAEEYGLTKGDDFFADALSQEDPEVQEEFERILEQRATDALDYE
jgi:hypothetical protein